MLNTRPLHFLSIGQLSCHLLVPTPAELVAELTELSKFNLKKPGGSGTHSTVSPKYGTYLASVVEMCHWFKRDRVLA